MGKSTVFGLTILFTVLAHTLVAAQAGDARGLRADLSWRSDRGSDQVRAYQFRSDLLDEDCRVFVALPSSHFDTTRAYPLILVFDGEWILQPVVAAASALARAGHAPEAVIVSVENTDRLRDLSPPGLPVSGNDGSGRADRFLRFLEDELRPTLGEAFRASGPITLVGHSTAGLFVHYAVSARTETFRSVLSLDAPMHLGNGRATDPLVQQAAGSDGRVALVSLETRYGWPSDAWESLTQSAPADWTLVRNVVPDETHESMAWPSVYPGIKALYARYSTVANPSVSPMVRLGEFDARIPMDESMPPPRILLRQLVEDQLLAVNATTARSALDRLAVAYGENDDVCALLQEIAALDGTQIEGPPVEELLATPRASAEAIQVLVGEWRGYTQMEGATGRLNRTGNVGDRIR